jgi:hypothetical protein
MAVVLPLMTAEVRALAIADPELRRVYTSTYAAFRRRRSLLLLNLEAQAKLDELPWIAAVAPWIGKNDASRDAARETMVRVTRLALEAFPHTLVPNRLVKELRALAPAADVAVPLVDELAADIFMGAFSGNYLRAAQLAAEVLRGTLYERYYGLRYDEVLALDDIRKEQRGAPHSPGFAAMCRDLAGGEEVPRFGSPARSGTILEQAQILTTHNLVPLLRALELEATMRPELPTLARRCFAYVCDQLGFGIPAWHAQLRVVKNTAYAFRHMVLFLALSDPSEVASFVPWARRHLDGSRELTRQRLGPALAGLEVIVEGGRFDADGAHPPTGGRRFLGWSVGKHWML